VNSHSEKFDFHIHSKYSFDSILTPIKIISTSLKKGLTGIAIVDHDTIEGGKIASELNRTDLKIITGAEIKTEIGDIIGLFLKREIKSRKSIKVIEEIRGQNGIVVLPHPFKKHLLTEEILRDVDLIEGFNGRVSNSSNLKAQELARDRNLPIIAGSDAHFSFEIGRAITQFNTNGFVSKDLKIMLLKEPRELSGKSQILCYEIASQIIKKVKGS